MWRVFVEPMCNDAGDEQLAALLAAVHPLLARASARWPDISEVPDPGVLP